MSDSPFDLDVLSQNLARYAPRPADESPRAAVVAVLREVRGADTEVLFIERAVVEGDPWSGHMAFPGGRVEPHDESLEATALRETVEELGLDLRSAGARLGQLDDVPTHKSGLVVSPFVYRVDDLPELRPNREVAQVHWTPITPLWRGDADTEYPVQYRGESYKFPGYQVGPKVVWGLTYRMMQLLFAQVR